MSAADEREHIEYQCETLPFRFVGTKKPTNTLETVCQELTESYDDEMLAAALLPTARARRRALAGLCDKDKAGYCAQKQRGKKRQKAKKRTKSNKKKKHKEQKEKKRKRKRRRKKKANRGKKVTGKPQKEEL